MARSLLLRPGMTARDRRTRAFTLVELMIVIVIVAVLSVIAVVGYRRLVLSAHSAEATNMIQSIRTAQEAYHAETQTYVSTSSNLFSGMYPIDPPGAFKTGWGAGIAGACPPLPGASLNCWSALPVHVDSAVMYSYSTIGGQAGNLSFPSASPISVTYPAAASMDWYFIGAKGDVNGDGVFSYVLGTSYTNDLFFQNEGE